jgi:hypothetical protein
MKAKHLGVIRGDRCRAIANFPAKFPDTREFAIEFAADCIHRPAIFAGRSPTSATTSSLFRK